mmetsp:Transcript_18157/g.30155  ORF Transcript_18157/g.30155 Transcript_18157/m.30155 type:complete len:271 (-) Transcript_18157:132-944(-)
MVKSSRNILAIGLVLCCALSTSVTATHRDAVTSRRRSQRGVDVFDEAQKYDVSATPSTCTSAFPPTFFGATRYRGGGGDRNEQSSDSFLKRHPFASAVTITACNAVIADIFTQLIVQQKSMKEWDGQRTALLGTFGLLFQGCAQYTVVNVVWERLFPGTSPKSVLAKIMGMNLLSDPLLFFPCFYAFQTFLEQRQLAIGSAMERYSQNCWTDWRNSWMVWFPGHTITYAVMPPHRRIPWMAFLSFFYMCILSFTRGGGGASVAGSDALHV